MQSRLREQWLYSEHLNTSSFETFGNNGGRTVERIGGGNKGILLKMLLPNSVMIYIFSVKRNYQRLRIKVYESKVGILRRVASRITAIEDSKGRNVF